MQSRANFEGTFDKVSPTLKKVVSTFAPGLYANGGTQGLVLHTVQNMSFMMKVAKDTGNF